MKKRITGFEDANDILRSASEFAAFNARCSMFGGVPSTGTVGEPCDNAMAEVINALHDTELIRAREPWRAAPLVGLVTLEQMWKNNQRVHSELHYRTRPRPNTRT